MGRGIYFLVYKSSAGSGKTFTLARVFLSLAVGREEANYFRRILAITFTVKAATEMKSRIVDYLSAFAGRPTKRKDIATMLELVARDTGLSEAEIRARSENVLMALVHHYGDLSILTIDKFIHRLVRSFAADLDLQPDFEVEIEQQKLVETVVEKLFAKVGNDPDITRVVMEFMALQVDDGKSWDVAQPLSELASELNSEEFFLKSKHFESLGLKDVFEIQRWLSGQINTIETQCKQTGETALNIVTSAGLNAQDFYHTKSGIFGYFKKAASADLDYVTKPNSYVLTTIVEDKWASATKNPAVEDVADRLRTLYHALAVMIPDLQRVVFYKRLRPALYTMSLIGELRHLYRETKEDENLQTLGDFYQMLSERFAQEYTPFIYERLGNRYNHILIDEFQDTSTLQWHNLLPLVENSLSEGYKSLIVGDAKQSIYRFRGSEPEQFVRLPKTGTAADPLFESTYSGRVLNTNFRSAKTVVDFNNRFFAQLKSKLLSEELMSVYDDLAQEGHKTTPGKVAIRCIEEWIADVKIPFATACANAMTKRIRAMITHEGFTQRDICLLFQKNADAASMASHLLTEGFSVVSDESLLLANNHAVCLVMATLFAHANPTDPFRQQQWLARLYQSGFLGEDYHVTATHIKEEKLGFGAIVKKLSLKLDPTALSSGMAFSAVFHLAQYYGFNTGDAFVRKLLDYALEFDQQSHYLKKTFLAKWEGEAATLSIEATGDSDALRIMTVHKSKGLEFPAVLLYLPNLTLRKTTRDFAWITELEDIPGLQAALMPTNQLQNTPYSGHYDREHERTKMDLLNTLYVAFTRAERHLEVFTDGKNKKPTASELEFITTWPEWDKENAELVVEG